MDNGPIYDVAPDGQKFLFLVPWEDDVVAAASVTLLLGWRGLVEKAGTDLSRTTPRNAMDGQKKRATS
jgi:hypothetical protein